ncbi:protein of unknown function [Kyrpidia spormannii]|uniref:Uncharacterized protein n=1 Tax=Kyrpidia spormannii TaxID=2055160 RepID=A0A6F9E072_9BACL|nr:protein of unknown function [Kyrpidia spormannii]
MVLPFMLRSKHWFTRSSRVDTACSRVRNCGYTAATPTRFNSFLTVPASAWQLEQLRSFPTLLGNNCLVSVMSLYPSWIACPFSSFGALSMLGGLKVSVEADAGFDVAGAEQAESNTAAVTATDNKATRGPITLLLIKISTPRIQWWVLTISTFDESTIPLYVL